MISYGYDDAFKPEPTDFKTITHAGYRGVLHKLGHTCPTACVVWEGRLKIGRRSIEVRSYSQWKAGRDRRREFLCSSSGRKDV